MRWSGPQRISRKAMAIRLPTQAHGCPVSFATPALIFFGRDPGRSDGLKKFLQCRIVILCRRFRRPTNAGGGCRGRRIHALAHAKTEALPDILREPVILRFFKGHSYAEIADQLSITKCAACKRISWRVSGYARPRKPNRLNLPDRQESSKLRVKRSDFQNSRRSSSILPANAVARVAASRPPTARKCEPDVSRANEPPCEQCGKQVTSATDLRFSNGVTVSKQTSSSTSRLEIMPAAGYR